jgi:hypothetical protein
MMPGHLDKCTESISEVRASLGQMIPSDRVIMIVIYQRRFTA